jgi:hypothetical protein
VLVHRPMIQSVFVYKIVPSSGIVLVTKYQIPQPGNIVFSSIDSLIFAHNLMRKVFYFLFSD